MHAISQYHIEVALACTPVSLALAAVVNGRSSNPHADNLLLRKMVLATLRPMALTFAKTILQIVGIFTLALSTWLYVSNKGRPAGLGHSRKQS